MKELSYIYNFPSFGRDSTKEETVQGENGDKNLKEH